MLSRLLSLGLFWILCCVCIGCVETTAIKKGNVTELNFSSEVLKRDVAFNMYNPIVDGSSNPEYILYLLHGHGGDHQDWFQETEGDVARILDSLIHHKIIPPVIAVSVDAGNSWYVDRFDLMETFYISEFIPMIEKPLNSSQKLNRVIAGNSAGGYGSLRFAMQNPKLFEQAILLSPAAYNPLPPKISSSRKIDVFAENGTFNDSIWKSYSYVNLVPGFLKSTASPKFYLSVGDDDAYNIVPVVSELQQLFWDEGIANELRITDGGHDWTCWKKNFSDALTEIFTSVSAE